MEREREGEGERRKQLHQEEKVRKRKVLELTEKLGPCWLQVEKVGGEREVLAPNRPRTVVDGTPVAVAPTSSKALASKGASAVEYGGLASLSAARSSITRGYYQTFCSTEGAGRSRR